MKENTLPNAWTQITIKNALDFVLGGDWGKDPLKFEDENYSEVLCIRGSEIKHWQENKGNTAVRRLIKNASLEKRKLQIGDILIEISGGGPDQPVGRTVYIDEQALAHKPDVVKVCTNFLRLLRFNESLNRKFINKFFDYFYLSGRITEYQGGSNNLRNLKFKEFETIQIPLPSRLEQDRIVAKVDALMAQVSVMQESLQRIPQLLKDFRQQVLTQAVTGKLTEEWREGKDVKSSSSSLEKLKNARELNATKSQLKKLEEIYSDSNSSIDFSIPTNWIEANLDKVCLSFSYGTSTKSDDDGIYPVLRMGNMQNGKVDWKKLKYTSDIKELKKYKLEKGDVLFNRTNSPELVGKTSIFDSDRDAIYAGYLIRIKNTDILDSKYLNYTLNSFYGKKWCWKAKTDGVSQSNINATKLAKFTIPFPLLEEQQEIVRCVESLFSKAGAIQQQYEALKQKIDTLPQAILHKAFKGELVEQIESDGSAEELLREIEGLNHKI